MEYRNKCLSEKGEKCVECGTTEDVEVHHVDGDRLNNTLENLIPVCRSCHAKIHSDSDEMEHWREKLLPEEKRTQTIAVEASPELKAMLELVKAESSANSYTEAVRHVLAEYHEIYSLLRDHESDLPAEISANRNTTYRLSESVANVLETQADDIDEILTALS